MNASRIQRWALRIGGTLILAIGLGHAFMPTLGYQPSASQGMSPVVRDHFYYLGTYAIGTFLLGFAALTFIHSARPDGRQTLAFSLVGTGVWAVRVVLELAYPVNLPIFLLERPHAQITGVLIAITASFATASLAYGLGRLRQRRRVTTVGAVSP